MMSPAKAGAFVGVTGKTVKNWIRSGVLPADSWMMTPTGRFQVDLGAVLRAVSGNRSLGLDFVPPAPRRAQR